jgi:ribose-phosphate pyrophosphokinase
MIKLSQTPRPRKRDHAACTHGLFTDGALERIQGRPEVEEVVCTNIVLVAH